MSTAIRATVTLGIVWGMISLVWWAGGQLDAGNGGYWFTLAAIAGALILAVIATAAVILTWTLRR
jgi:hypothetical protein